MTDWDLLTPGIGLTSIGIVGVGISLAGIAKTFIDGMHAVSLLTMFIGMIFLASGLFKDGFPMSGRAKSATFITLGFLVTFGVAAAVTVSSQVPSIFSYIGLMLIISIPAAVIAVASYRDSPHIKALAIIFIAGSVVGATTFYAFGLVSPKLQTTEPEEGSQPAAAPGGNNTATNSTSANVVTTKILAGASSQQNPDFSPEKQDVPKGSVIEWVNEDNTPHTITSLADQGKTFDSNIIAKGKTFRLDTSKLEEQKYEYYCKLHPFMKGEFTVTSASSAGTPGASGSANNSTAPSGGNKETISASIVKGAATLADKAFSPSPITAEKGQIVKWINDDTNVHTVTSKADSGKTFDSKILQPGKEFTLDTSSLSPSDYQYYCQLHPTMVGTLDVVEAGAGQGTAVPTDNQTSSSTPATSGNNTNSTASSGSSGNNTSSGGQSSSTAQPSGSSASVTSVSISSGSSVATNKEFFVPQTVETAVGSMVTWKNNDFTFHTVTQGSSSTPEDERAFDSKVIGKGTSFSYVFDKAGTYEYYCMLHPYMTGQVIVK